MMDVGIRGAGPGCPVGSAHSHTTHLFGATMLELFFSFPLYPFPEDYLIHQKHLVYLKTGQQSQKGSDAN